MERVLQLIANGRVTKQSTIADLLLAHEDANAERSRFERFRVAVLRHYPIRAYEYTYRLGRVDDKELVTTVRFYCNRKFYDYLNRHHALHIVAVLGDDKDAYICDFAGDQGGFTEAYLSVTLDEALDPLYLDDDSDEHEAAENIEAILHKETMAEFEEDYAASEWELWVVDQLHRKGHTVEELYHTVLSDPQATAQCKFLTELRDLFSDVEAAVACDYNGLAVAQAPKRLRTTE